MGISTPIAPARHLGAARKGLEQGMKRGLSGGAPKAGKIAGDVLIQALMVQALIKITRSTKITKTTRLVAFAILQHVVHGLGSVSE